MQDNNEWKQVCAACAEGTPPERCAYYGEPNGCNAPKTGQHPTAREELNKAANICLFVKENCGDMQTARYMAEAITAINEAVSSSNTTGNAAALREALKEALKFLRTNRNGYFESRLIPQIEAALAAPARNCDRFATYAEAVEAYREWTRRTTGDVSNVSGRGMLGWLFAPAEGGV